MENTREIIKKKIKTILQGPKEAMLLIVHKELKHNQKVQFNVIP